MFSTPGTAVGGLQQRPWHAPGESTGCRAVQRVIQSVPAGTIPVAVAIQPALLILRAATAVLSVWIEGVPARLPGCRGGCAYGGAGAGFSSVSRLARVTQCHTAISTDETLHAPL